MRESEDPFVMVWEGPSLEGDVIAAALERALVPVGRDAAPDPGRMRIEVPRSYVREAAELIESGDLFPDTPAELLGDVSESRTISIFGSRFVLIGIALLLLVAILLAYRY